MLIDSARACRLYFSNAVQNEAAGILVRSKLSAVGQRLGFSEHKRERMALVAAEMVSNQLKYARGQGLIQIWEQPGHVIDILALDFGPGIANLQLAQQDGYSSHNTLGKGLGSIQRLSDEAHFYTRTEAGQGAAKKWSGTAVMARFRADEASVGELNGFGLFARSLSDERYNGDHFYLYPTRDRLRWLHLDGLGHGQPAEEATSNLGKHLLAIEGLDATLEAVDRQLRGTRGAVAILGEVDWGARQLQMRGVGDMQAYVMQADALQRISFAPGVLGKEHKRPQPVQVALAGKGLVMSATDGIRRNWDEESFPGLYHLHPQLIAYVLGNIMGRISDDQSLCVVRLP